MIRRLWRVNHESSPKGLALLLAFLFVLLIALNTVKSLEFMVFFMSFWSFVPQATSANGNAKRCTLFYASLPIPARAIFLSSLLLPIRMYWLILATALAATAATHREALGIIFVHVLDAGSVTTFGLIALSSIRAQEFQAPKIWKWIFAVLALVVLLLVTNGVDDSGLPISARYVVPPCVVASIALLWITLRNLPASFETAPRKATRPKSGKSIFDHTFRLPASGWTVVLRSLSGAQFFLWLSFLCFLAFLGMERIAMQIAGIPIAGIATWTTLGMIKRKYPWLSSLPIRWQIVFTAIAVAPLAALVIGMAAHSFGKPARGAVVGLLIVEVGSLVPGVLIGVPSFVRQHRKIWAKLRLYTMAGALVWGIAAAIGVGRVPIDTWLSKALPLNPVLFGATALAIVGISFCVAYTGFRRMEVRPGGADALAAARRAASGGRWG